MLKQVHGVGNELFQRAANLVESKPVMKLKNEFAYLAGIVFLDPQTFVKSSPGGILNSVFGNNRDVDATGNMFVLIRGRKVEVAFRCVDP